MPRTPRYWTREEDDILRQWMDDCTNRGLTVDWCGIAAKLPGRTNKDCRKRWHNAVAAGINKGQWTKEEDELLEKGVREYGQKKWPAVAEVVKNRSADQCAKRWQQSLNPELDRSEWTDQDDEILLEAVSKIGRHWTHIQRLHFLSRSKNAIKNRYSVITRRMQKQNSLDLSSLPDEELDKGKNPLRRPSSASSNGDREEDSSTESSDESNKYVDHNMETAQLLPQQDSAMDWLQYDYQPWNVDPQEGLGGVFESVDPIVPPSSMSIADLTGSSHSHSDSSSPWGSDPLSSACILPSDPFPPNDTVQNNQMFDISSLEQAIPSTGQVHEDERVQFTLTMNRPTVNTIQQLVKVAIETQSRFKIERE